MVKIDSFYIKLFFIISLFLLDCLPVLAEEETAELSIESNFNISRSFVRDCERHNFSCIDTVTKLDLKNTHKKSVDFIINERDMLLSVLENGEKAKIKFADHYPHNIITVSITSPNSLITISTSTRNHPASILRTNSNFSSLTITSPYPKIDLNSINWEIYSDNSTYFTYDKFSHGYFSESDKNASVLNTENSHFNASKQSTSDYYFKINKRFYAFSILSVIAFAVLTGIGKYIKNVLCFPFYCFSDKTTNNKKYAFTLIELLIVIVIIGILAAMATPNFHHRCRPRPSEYNDCIKAQKQYTLNQLKSLANDANDGLLTANTYNITRSFYKDTDDCCCNLGLYYFDEKNEICCTLHGKESTGNQNYYNYDNPYYNSFVKYFNYEIPIYKYNYYNEELPYCSFVANKINPVDSHLSLEIKYVGREGWQLTMFIKIAVYIFVFFLPFIFGKKIEKWRNS